MKNWFFPELEKLQWNVRHPQKSDISKRPYFTGGNYEWGLFLLFWRIL